jgi:hypothetical protein
LTGANGRKVSESFFFQLNNGKMLSMLDKPGRRHAKQLPPCERGMFTLNHASNTVWMVLSVYKVLQGDLESFQKPYIKHASLADREKKTVQARVPDACLRFGEFRQLFVWSATPLFGDDGKFRDDKISFPELYRQPKANEAFTVDQILDNCRGLASKKKKEKDFTRVPGNLIVTVS